MRKLALMAVALATGVLIAAGSAVAAGGGTPKTYTVKMAGGQEVPKGSPTGSGLFKYQLKPGKKGKGLFCYSVSWSKIDTPNASHIHKGPKGKAGNVVIPLFTAAPGKHSGCVTTTNSLLAAIKKTPSAYYVNVHTAKYPGGAIRGQL
jgi:hypothetical protein